MPSPLNHLLSLTCLGQPATYEGLLDKRGGSPPRGDLPSGEGIYPDAGAEVGLAKTVDAQGNKRTRSAPPLLVTESGDRYLRGPLIAQGGFKKVYLGLSESRQPVAIAIFRSPARAAYSAQHNGQKLYKPRATFVTKEEKAAIESATTARFEPGLAPVGQGRGQARLFQVLPLVEGDLIQTATAARADTRQAPMLRALALSSLAYGGAKLVQMQEHSEGLVLHGDIKPANLLLSSDGSIRLGDWGLASQLPPGLTSAVGGGGTYRYMPREGIMDRRRSSAADTFALGVSAVEIATGKNPLSMLQTIYSPPDAPQAGLKSAYLQLEYWLKAAPRGADGSLSFALIGERFAAGGAVYVNPQNTQRDGEMDQLALRLSTVVGEGHADFLLRRMLSLMPEDRAPAQEVSSRFAAHAGDNAVTRKDIKRSIKVLGKARDKTAASSRSADIKALDRAWTQLGVKKP